MVFSAFHVKTTTPTPSGLQVRNKEALIIRFIVYFFGILLKKNFEGNQSKFFDSRLIFRVFYTLQRSVKLNMMFFQVVDPYKKNRKQYRKARTLFSPLQLERLENEFQVNSPECGTSNQIYFKQ